MKVKRLLSIIVAGLLTLCIALPVFANESRSLADLFESLVDVDEEGLFPNSYPNSYSLNEVAFAVPDGLQLMDEGIDSLIFADDYYSPTAVLTVEYLDAQGENIDLTNVNNQADLIRGITGQGVDNVDYYINTVDNHNAIEVTFSQTDGVQTAYSHVILVELNDALFVVNLTTVDAGYGNAFDQVKNSIRDGSGSASDNHSTEDSSLINIDVPDLVITPPVESVTGSSVTDISFSDEVVLIDNDLCRVTITDFVMNEESDWYRYYVVFYGENKSNRRLNIWTEEESLNGFMVDAGAFLNGLEPGMSKESKMYCSLDDFADNNITSVNEIAFKLIVTDIDTATTYEKKYFSIYPDGVNTPPQPEQQFDEADIVVADNEWFKMVITGEQYSPETYHVFIPLYIENRSNKNIYLNATFNHSAVNGYETTTFFMNPELPAGKKANTSVYWDRSALESNGIGTIETIDLNLQIQNNDDKFEIYYEDSFHIDLR